jgi:hypothetical protein
VNSLKVKTSYKEQEVELAIPARAAGGFVSEKVNLPVGTCGELTASPKPSVRLGTNSVGVLGTMLSSPASS